MVARVLWEHEVAGSSPVAPTISKQPATEEITMNNIHKCPVCESYDVVIREHNYEYKKVYMIWCRDCGTALTRNTIEQVINAWNVLCEEYKNE